MKKDLIPCPKCSKLKMRSGMHTHIWRMHTAKGRKHSLVCAQVLVKYNSNAEGLTYAERYGENRASDILKALSKSLKGKNIGNHGYRFHKENCQCSFCRSHVGSGNPFYGKKLSLENMVKMQKANFVFPNSKEKILLDLLNMVLPNKYRYVGNHKRYVDRFCPDFIDSNQMKIIELFGDYWHSRPNSEANDRLRIETYKKFGYKTLIIWERELKNIEILIQKILNFDLI